MKHVWTPLIAAYAIAATYALVFGAFNLIRKKKSDKPHRAIGFVWLGSMYFAIKRKPLNKKELPCVT